MTVLRRLVVILLFAVGVLVVWSWIGRTPWALTVDPLDATEQFTDAVAPLRKVVGALLVTVPAVLLIRSAWSWIGPNLLGRETRSRFPPQHQTDPSRPVGRPKRGDPARARPAAPTRSGSSRPASR